MNLHTLALDFPAILEKLQEHALSQRARDVLGALSPYLSEEICVQKMAETTAARNILDSCGSPPLSPMSDLDEILALAESGAMLVCDQLMSVVSFCASCKRMTSYLARGESAGETVAVYGRSIEDLSLLRDEIERCVRGEDLFDEASPALRDIRRKILKAESQIKEKLNHILQSRKQYLADGYITTRNGHYVLPVQKKFQSQFGGTVIDASGKGSTVFMEPTAVASLQAELQLLHMNEDEEMRRILYALSAMVADRGTAIRRNIEAMEILDVLFAKAKLSAAMKARPITVGTERKIQIKQGRHPLLKQDDCVPLDFYMDESTAGVIITGPNTGGKTVAVKTVGLLSLMAQCGLHVPCEPGSYVAMHDRYLCDIGDSQNISQNLSTFSGHMTNVIEILRLASCDSFVLLDELGSGTDPAEGMGIAIAVLEELRLRGCMFLVTTHYPQVKTYAESHERILSARMAFDRESLRPLYRLEMGKVGESCALHIAKRLGLAQHLLDHAHQQVYGQIGADAEQTQTMEHPKSILKRAVVRKESVNLAEKFAMGDSVIVQPEGELGIVYRPADENGDVVVQIKGEKRKIKHSRLILKLPASELYPPDYDFSIIFDSVQNRKARKQMGKHHDPSLSITYDNE